MFIDYELLGYFNGANYYPTDQNIFTQINSFNCGRLGNCWQEKITG